jgi:hypothetical protein
MRGLFAQVIKDTSERHGRQKTSYYYNPESPLFDPRKKAKSEGNTSESLTLRKPDCSKGGLMFSMPCWITLSARRDGRAYLKT